MHRVLRRSLWLPALVAFGLGSRLPGFPEWVKSYVGDVIWGAFFYALYACVRPRWSARALWLAALLTTEAIEFSQLYRAEWADRVRSTPLGALLFGRDFLWSDVACVALGACIASALHSAASQRSEGAVY